MRTGPEDVALEALLSDQESDRVERKVSDADRDRICEAICAFANDLPGHGGPGVVFVGVDDKCDCAHLAIPEDRLLRLSDLRSNGNIYPFPTMTVRKRRLRDCEMIVITVQPSHTPPVRFCGRTWVRVGPRRALATLKEERRLAERRRARDVPFDIRPVAGTSIAALDLDRFEKEYLPAALSADTLARNGRTFGRSSR